MNNGTMNKAIITGINGFVGSSLADYLSKHDWLVAGLTRQESDGRDWVVTTNYEPANLARIIKDTKPSVIIHAAGSSSVNDSITSPSTDFSKSVLLFQNILEGVRLSQEKPLIVYLSSAAVYGNPERLPVRETDSVNPISPYGYNKLICELLASEYAQCYSIPILAVRLFSIIGPKQKKLLVWELFRQFEDSDNVVIEGTGEESRDYIYVDDLAEVLRLMITKMDCSFKVVNVASGKDITVHEIVYLMKELLDSKKSIDFLGKSRQGHPLKWCADVGEMKRIVGDSALPDFRLRLEELLNIWKTQGLN
jgi:UDP-glucose 4-epimerase